MIANAKQKKNSKNEISDPLNWRNKNKISMLAYQR